MVRASMRTLAVAVCLAVVSFTDNATSQQPAGIPKGLDGLWTGSWGGGRQGQIVFQPVIAELMIKGDQVELDGFRNVNRLAGTLQIDIETKRMRITPAAAAGQPTPKAIEFTYEFKRGSLTLTDGDKFSISFQRRPVAENPLANVQVELVIAEGINSAGELLVTEITVLKAVRTGASFYQPEPRSLSTKQATVLQVREGGLSKITLDEARRLIRSSTPVVVAYRPDDRPAPPQLHKLWQDTGSAPPDAEVVWRMFSKVLWPGTLVFILSARENAARP